MMLWSLHTKNTRLISHEIIFDVTITIKTYLITILQHHGRIYQFFSIYGIYDLNLS